MTDQSRPKAFYRNNEDQIPMCQFITLPLFLSLSLSLSLSPLSATFPLCSLFIVSCRFLFTLLMPKLTALCVRAVAAGERAYVLGDEQQCCQHGSGGAEGVCAPCGEPGRPAVQHAEGGERSRPPSSCPLMSSSCLFPLSAIQFAVLCPSNVL